jgi:hypothetical protein
MVYFQLKKSLCFGVGEGEGSIYSVLKTTGMINQVPTKEYKM